MAFPLEVENLVASLSVKGRKLEHVFAPVTEEDWLAYDAGVRLRFTRLEDGSTEIDSAAIEAVCALWDKRILGVLGYGLDLPEDWKERIPIHHKEAAVAALAQVAPWEGQKQEDLLMVGGRTIVLDAVRNGEKYVVTHNFKAPAQSQVLRYRRAKGKRLLLESGASVYPSALPELLKLYGELIESVEGYEPNDPAKVDALHKRCAVEALLGNG